jgi:hypothetical protein
MNVLFFVTEWMLPIALVCGVVATLVAVVREPSILSWCLLVATLCLSGSLILGWLAYGELRADIESAGDVVRIIPDYSMLMASKLLMVIALGATIAGSLVYIFRHRKHLERNAR